MGPWPLSDAAPYGGLGSMGSMVGATCFSDSSELVVAFELETVLVFMDAELGQIVMLLLDPERAGCC